MDMDRLVRTGSFFESEHMTSAHPCSPSHTGSQIKNTLALSGPLLPRPEQNGEAAGVASICHHTATRFSLSMASAINSSCVADAE